MRAKIPLTTLTITTTTTLKHKHKQSNNAMFSSRLMFGELERKSWCLFFYLSAVRTEVITKRRRRRRRRRRKRKESDNTCLRAFKTASHKLGFCNLWRDNFPCERVVAEDLCCWGCVPFSLYLSLFLLLLLSLSRSLSHVLSYVLCYVLMFNAIRTHDAFSVCYFYVMFIETTGKETTGSKHSIPWSRGGSVAG